jgi:YD repeat-containing protein
MEHAGVSRLVYLSADVVRNARARLNFFRRNIIIPALLPIMRSTKQWFNKVVWTGSLCVRIAGNILTERDPNGNPTSFGYNDDGQNRYAFPTSFTNALGQRTSIGYDYSIGKPVVVVDSNGVSTAFSYNDPLDRVTQVRRAAGAGNSIESQTNYSYPSPNQVTIAQDQTNTGDGLIVTSQIFDGLGREWKNLQYETGAQWIETDKTYDAGGRAATATNPFRTGDTPALTTYQYGLLGRPISVTTPDEASTQIAYSGQFKYITDPAGSTKKYWYDAAGRLYNVIEDPNGLNYTTDYRYDALDNLVLVSQGYCPNCRQRSFTYDALSRLTQAVNPESGTVSYGYDANGNLTSRTDARGITTRYAYDALNRVVSKTYSDSTPAVTYRYDDSSVSHGVGQLAEVTNGISTTKYLAYDPLGRVTASQQLTSDEAYNFSYTYDLAGSLASETYPSRRVVTTGYDAANRPSWVNGNLAGQQAAYASGVSYAPHGAPNFFR